MIFKTRSRIRAGVPTITGMIFTEDLLKEKIVGAEGKPVYWPEKGPQYVVGKILKAEMVNGEVWLTYSIDDPEAIKVIKGRQQAAFAGFAYEPETNTYGPVMGAYIYDIEPDRLEESDEYFHQVIREKE
ncbi:hypothetical protein MTAT_18930 [Moorella thermoacetica]|uniref:Uncharacterized protein n=1 Tax=Neomoorella thermoacetica TaxID=1525 RepID=A0AAC9HIL1_NEOTH|nr:hypothetical protein [Moorella thermoacetica]AOQ24550.1 hypothetical protein Maut_02120 [Moorella thermoacetica]TYL12651.1 hypothetical protein MTAT_18930 [Moorella thermoacetica]